MEGCLLCLEIDKDFVECIKVDSTQWQELNIKTLIEKHLWIMVSVGWKKLEKLKKNLQIMLILI